MRKEKRSLAPTWRFLLLSGVLLGAIFLGLAAGASSLSLPQALGEVIQGDLTSPQARILLHVRLPRVLACLLSGGAFAGAGLILQAVLHNPLASPNIIGVNAGAGFFTFLCLALFPGQASLLPLGAFFGALLATLLVYAIAAVTGAKKVTLVLAGVAISSIFTAGINTVKTFFPDTLYNGSSFLIGGFSGVALQNLSPAWVMILLALGVALFLAPQVDVLCLGEETAGHLGMRVKPMRFMLILLACILAGAAVSFSGLVSFVGLIVPHIARKLFGHKHSLLLPAGCLMGAAFVVLCDVLSRVVFAPYEIPVGIVLSFLGGPFFLFLLLRKGESF